ncbi:helix-turn-helix domain-containing protein [Streptomyces sp. 4503]|uniref:Helix-turn-helix domain-containing protein n=1 Tax=Streptomyces niphimycinicus TaxID=2842201 RepID=A0ABS6CUU6_9ACTN|nr:helix-turn-helix domain-containing protein [Streptomyces niphimycinicus]MBU3870733.1 helix-turn-helix domain-containing protein [Streptomyces niphimycinicus]
MSTAIDSYEERRRRSTVAASERTIVLTTRSVPPSESLDYWHDAVLDTLVGMDIATEGRTYDATLRTDRLGDLRITTVEADPGQVHRAPRFIARGDGREVFVAVQSTGRAQVEQDGRTTELRTGDIGFFETIRPFRSTFPERFRLKIFAVPRPLLELPEAGLRELTARSVRPSGGLPALLAPLLERLADTSESYPTPTAERLAESVIGLVAATAADQLGADPAELPGADGVLLLRIKTYIRWHLSDPGLAPSVIAGVHGISVRYLHRLFEAEGSTVCQWIREQRLRECRKELAAQPPGSVSLGQVARRWGFASPAAFGKAFRNSFGLSPTDWLGRVREGRVPC